MAGETQTTTTVKTPNGTSVEVLLRSPDFTTEEKKSMDAEIKSLYPNAIKLRTASIKYNCHSYAWYSQSSNNKYWMNDPSAYMTDGSYTRALRMITGLKGCTFSKTHSVIVSKVDGMEVSKVKSKWGAYGLYEHHPNYSPYIDPVIAYYY